MKKTQTIDLKGKAYAQVKDRLKEFRTDNPNGLIETTPTITDTSIVFKARILKDKSDPSSAEATGHSYARFDKSPEKQFEKQETIAVGRALALLGYAVDGDIASSEEMEEFLTQKEFERMEHMEEVRQEVDAITTIEDLKVYYQNNKGLGKDFDAYVTKRKGELQNS